LGEPLRKKKLHFVQFFFCSRRAIRSITFAASPLRWFRFYPSRKNAPIKIFLIFCTFIANNKLSLLPHFVFMPRYWHFCERDSSGAPRSGAYQADRSAPEVRVGGAGMSEANRG
jgi:hypothetical protein